MPKLGDPCPVSNAHSALLSCLLSLHFLGFTSQEPQLSSAPQLLCQPGGMGTINKSPPAPQENKGFTGDSDEVGSSQWNGRSVCLRFPACPPFPPPPSSSCGLWDAQEGEEGNLYGILVPLPSQVPSHMGQAGGRPGNPKSGASGLAECVGQTRGVPLALPCS